MQMELCWVSKWVVYSDSLEDCKMVVQMALTVANMLGIPTDYQLVV